MQPGSGGWITALRLHGLHKLASGLASRPPSDIGFGDLLEPGDVPVHLATDDAWPSEMQLLSLRWLLHMDEELATALQASIFAVYPSLRATYDFLPESESAARLPEIADASALRPRVRLNALTIHAIAHASTPYLGADFSCAWDEEHGLGVITVGTDVLDIGTGDVSQARDIAQAHRDAVLAKPRSE